MLPVEIAAAHWWKIHFPLWPLKPSELSAASFVVSLGFFCFCPFIPHSGTRLHAAVAPSLSSVTFNSRFLTAATKALHSPQISTLSSRPSSQSFSPSQSHCLAIHLFFEQANWFHKHEESAEGNRREMTIAGDSIDSKKQRWVNICRIYSRIQGPQQSHWVQTPHYSHIHHQPDLNTFKYKKVLLDAILNKEINTDMFSVSVLQSKL